MIKFEKLDTLHYVIGIVLIILIVVVVRQRMLIEKTKAALKKIAADMNPVSGVEKFGTIKDTYDLWCPVYCLYPSISEHLCHCPSDGNLDNARALLPGDDNYKVSVDGLASYGKTWNSPN